MDLKTTDILIKKMLWSILSFMKHENCLPGLEVQFHVWLDKQSVTVGMGKCNPTQYLKTYKTMIKIASK